MHGPASTLQGRWGVRAAVGLSQRRLRESRSLNSRAAGGLHRVHAHPQELSKSKLVFISMNVNYEYSGKFDWGRKPRAPAPVQHVLHAPPAGSRRRAPATGLFFLGVAGCWTPRKNSPEVSRRCEDPARGAFSLSSSSSYGDPARTDKSLLSSTFK